MEKMDHTLPAAPFVAKTYEMVSDPRTNLLIRWGKGDNSFLVLNPSDFSQLLLPLYFKHNNFSSFVRQLNTYGFRKVDPDRWEFAHLSFLRGQIHLLPRITRRTKKSQFYDAASSSSGGGINNDEKKDTAAAAEMEGEVEDVVLLRELHRLRQDQMVLDEELQRMSKRLQATERKPRQMLSFLVQMAKEPQLVSRLVHSKKLQYSAAAKKRRLASVMPSLTPPHPPQELPVLVSEAFQQTVREPALLTQVYPGVAIHNTFNPIPAGNVVNPHEFGLDASSETTAAAAAANFPFSLLGHVFF
ncbi:heat stress transcription factor C-1a-like [Zingiber officinale]|uniref:HSF-type DNA-binding domain-containing protein n=1 Tax=Zingiber officinale TaxID=94328 RepID=A0A8J5C077_ZINOF|nr:heat stress transcription factor C-1a-like [Zingiber officinale]KAG6469491.1 hypothetical protein ZIOFF_074214 [Zingiber officinale]